MAPVFDFLYRFARVFHSDFRNRNFPPPLTRLSDTPYIRSEYSDRYFVKTSSCSLGRMEKIGYTRMVISV